MYCLCARVVVEEHQADNDLKKDVHIDLKGVGICCFVGCGRSPRAPAIAGEVAAGSGTGSSIFSQSLGAVEDRVADMDPRTRGEQAGRGSCSCLIAYGGMCLEGASGPLGKVQQQAPVALNVHGVVRVASAA